MRKRTGRGHLERSDNRQTSSTRMASQINRSLHLRVPLTSKHHRVRLFRKANHSSSNLHSNLSLNSSSSKGVGVASRPLVRVDLCPG